MSHAKLETTNSYSMNKSISSHRPSSTEEDIEWTKFKVNFMIEQIVIFGQCHT